MATPPEFSSYVRSSSELSGTGTGTCVYGIRLQISNHALSIKRDDQRHVDEDYSSFHVQHQHFGQSYFQTYEGFTLLYEIGMQSYKSTKGAGAGCPFRQVTIVWYCILEACRNKI